MVNFLSLLFIVALLFVGISARAFAWGVTVSDPSIDVLRNELIKQIGVDKIIASRFESAIHRLSILDQRLSSRITKTSDYCKSKTIAIKALDEARKIIPSDQIIIDSNSKIDKVSFETNKAVLNKSLSGMKSVVETLSKCQTATNNQR